MRLYKFQIQSLGSFYFENTKQGNSCAQLAIYPFQSLHIIYIQVQTYSCLSRSNVMPLKSVIVAHCCGLYTYTIVTPKSSMWSHEALHPPKIKKKKYMNGIHASSIKKMNE